MRFGGKFEMSGIFSFISNSVNRRDIKFLKDDSGDFFFQNTLVIPFFFRELLFSKI